ncbi:MAG: hypothetical protein AABW82_00985 [Nanoarchaeota archaeon]
MSRNNKMSVNWRDKQPSISDAAEKIVAMEAFYQLAESARHNISKEGPIRLVNLEARIDGVRLTPGIYRCNIMPGLDPKELDLLIVYQTDLRGNPTGYSGLEYAKATLSFPK